MKHLIKRMLLQPSSFNKRNAYYQSKGASYLWVSYWITRLQWDNLRYLRQGHRSRRKGRRGWCVPCVGFSGTTSTLLSTPGTELLFSMWISELEIFIVYDVSNLKIEEVRLNEIFSHLMDSLVLVFLWLLFSKPPRPRAPSIFIFISFRLDYIFYNLLGHIVTLLLLIYWGLLDFSGWFECISCSVNRCKGRIKIPGYNRLSITLTQSW